MATAPGTVSNSTASAAVSVGEQGTYSITQAAAFLGVSRVTVSRWVRAGRLPASRLGHRTVRIRHADLERLLLEARPPDERLRKVAVLQKARSLEAEIAERTQGEEARARLAAIVDSSYDAIVGKTLDGTITNWNAAAEQIFGYTAEEIVGRPVTVLIPAERQDEEREILARLRDGERVEHFETVRVRKDGRAIDVSITVSPIRDASGTIIGASKIARDITERKRLEAEVREQSEAVATIDRIGQLLSAELDLSKLVQAITDAATELTGAQFGAFFHNVLDERGESYLLYTLSGAPREAFERFPMPRNTAIFGPTFRGEGVIRIDDVTRDPRYGQNPPYHGMPPGHLPVRSYLATPVVSRSGEVLGGLFFGHRQPGVFTERSERLIAGIIGQAAIALDNARLYQQAQAAEARYRALFEGSADPVLVTDEHGRFLAVNAAFSTFLGYSWDELRGRPAAEVYAPTDLDAIRHHFEQLRRDGRWSGELEVRRKDGGTVPVEVHATAIDAPTGPAYLGTWRDISERRAVERMQRDFLAMVSHELRNPLATVKGFAQLMQRRGAYSARAVDGIIAQADHLDRLVGDLLDVARLRAGRLEIQRERLDLVALAAANVEQARARMTVHTIRLEAPTSPLVGRYDRGRLGQILQNLLDNAIKYVPSGEIVVRVVPNASEVLISVADHGPGIAREELPRLFDRFYRSDATAVGAQGFGIGLHVARNLVRAHGGRIWVESQPGRGSEFFFTLPRSANEDHDEP